MNSATSKISATRGSHKKTKLVMEKIRGKSYDEAMTYLTFSPRRISEKVSKILQSCRANYEYKHGRVDESRLLVKEAYCTQGPSLRRYQPKSMGRAGKVLKRTSNINIELVAK